MSRRPRTVHGHLVEDADTVLLTGDHLADRMTSRRHYLIITAMRVPGIGMLEAVELVQLLERKHPDLDMNELRPFERWQAEDDELY